MKIPDEEIGGGVVLQPFSINREGQILVLKRGTELHRDEILKMPRANRDALLNANFLDLYRRPRSTLSAATERPMAMVVPKPKARRPSVKRRPPATVEQP